jgi:hypothetical protein
VHASVAQDHQRNGDGTQSFYIGPKLPVISGPELPIVSGHNS